jgi:cytochrome c-type biogenesis protein CcmH/NrfG
MSLEHRSRTVALLLTLIPGLGHVYWGREGQGLRLFTLAALAAFVLLNAALIYVGSWRSILLVAATLGVVLVVLWCWLDILRLTAGDRVHADIQVRQEALWEGTLAYLKNDLPAARARFEACVRRDPTDVEALFRLAVVTARSGDGRRARALLRRTLRLDRDGTWEWEVGRELARLDGGSARERPVVAAAQGEQG